MGKSRYYYNQEACRYERIRWTFKKVVGYTAGLLFVGSLILGSIILVSDQLTQTKLEKNLSTENQALRTHQEILNSQLKDIETTLVSLKERDRNLHKRFFDDEPKQEPSHDGNTILLADAGYFNTLLAEIMSTSKSLLKESKTINSTFQNKTSIAEKDTFDILHVPTLQPISDPDLDLLISGYGTRINPFHKGKYFHPGIDFSAPKETPVVATAPGKITVVKRSDLMAGYGNYIEIDHGNGYKTRYAHLHEINVRVNQPVTKGMIIGTVGSSGGSIIPHLHYEILHNDKNVDPVNYLVEGLSSERYNLLLTISSNQNQSLD